MLLAPSVCGLFKWRQFEPEVILLAVGWYLMLGFKRFETAAVTIHGIELAEKIKKQQFNIKPLTGKAPTAPEMWAVVLAT